MFFMYFLGFSGAKLSKHSYMFKTDLLSSQWPHGTVSTWHCVRMALLHASVIIA